MQGVPAASGRRATMWHRLSAGWPTRSSQANSISAQSAPCSSTMPDPPQAAATSPGDIQITVLHEDETDGTGGEVGPEGSASQAAASTSQAGVATSEGAEAGATQGAHEGSRSQPPLQDALGGLEVQVVGR